jgi:hypothetical protein
MIPNDSRIRGASSTPVTVHRRRNNQIPGRTAGAQTRGTLLQSGIRAEPGVGNSPFDPSGGMVMGAVRVQGVTGTVFPSCPRSATCAGIRFLLSPPCLEIMCMGDDTGGTPDLGSAGHPCRASAIQSMLRNWCRANRKTFWRRTPGPATEQPQPGLPSRCSSADCLTALGSRRPSAEPPQEVRSDDQRSTGNLP